MKLLIGTLLTLGLLTQGTAMAESRAVACDGCSNYQMSQQAGRALNQGSVYVFNVSNRKLKLYTVFTEVIDESPMTQWSQVVERRVDWKLRRDWLKYIDHSRTLDEGGVVVLPPDFPIRSVAGALTDPSYANTSIEDYLASLSTWNQLRISLNATIARLLQNNIPLLDLSSAISSLSIQVEFPDGSWQDYEITMSINPIDGKARVEITPSGNAHTQDGRAAPTSPYAFSGRSFNYDNGALSEWIAWAQRLGLVVYGRYGAYGTSMTCEIEGNEVICTVRKSS